MSIKYNAQPLRISDPYEFHKSMPSQENSQSSVMFSQQSFTGEFNEKYDQQGNPTFRRNDTQLHEPSINSNHQLRNIQKIATLRLKMSVETVVSVFGNKAIGIYAYSFGMLRTAESLGLKTKRAKSTSIGQKTSFRSLESVPCLTEMDQQLFSTITQLFHRRLNYFTQSQNLRLISHAFWSISNYSNNSLTNTDLQFNSTENPCHSTKHKGKRKNHNESELDFMQSKGGVQAHEMLERQNKVLQKKKTKNKKMIESFYSQMDQLLSFHESVMEN